MEKKKVIILSILFVFFLFVSFVVGLYKLTTSIIIPTIKEITDIDSVPIELQEVVKLRRDGRYVSALDKVNRLIQKKQDSDSYYNEKGLILMNMNNYDQAIKAFNIAIEINPKNDSAYNNLSWAYNELGEYTKSLQYIDIALSIKSNSSTEYTNKGNALIGLDRYEEALKNYDLALEKDDTNIHAYYGKGVAYFNMERYEEASTHFIKYNELLNEVDEDALSYIISCYYNMDKSYLIDEYVLEEIFSFFRKTGSSKRVSNFTEKLYHLCNTFEMFEDYERALKYYHMAEKRLPENIDIFMNIGYIYYQCDNYEDSMKYYNKALSLEPNNTDALLWNVYNLIYLERYDEAREICENVISKDPDNEIAYNAYGNVYYEQGLFDKAIEYFDKAIEIDRDYEDAYLNKASSFFYNKQYSKCIDFCNEALLIFSDDLDMYWYMADSYSKLYNQEKAIFYYEKALEIAPSNENLLTNLGWEYYYLQDFESVEKYLNQVLDISADNEYALNLQNALDIREKPLNEQIVQFVNENYLYVDKVNDLDSKVSDFKSKDKITTSDIHEFIDSIKLNDDIFTFVITGVEYDLYSEYKEEDTVLHKTLDNQTHYIQISSFNTNTYSEFRQAIDSINNPEDKKLIIDLRSNDGGSIKAANDIIDVFLPNCVTSTIIDNDGYTSSYYSVPTQVKFKDIYIFVDEYSASSSELMTLGLKKYLDNVTVIGRPTYGKGVGQRVFEDKENKVIIYLVGFYWNVKEENIIGKRIMPDVYVDSDDFEAYFNEIR